MSNTADDINKFHGTRKGKLAFGAVELLLSYLLVSRAIDTGSLWEWLAALLFFIGGLNNLFRAVRLRVKSNAESKAKK